MTNEEAIKILNERLVWLEKLTDKSEYYALSMAINALKTQGETNES